MRWITCVPHAKWAWTFLEAGRGFFAHTLLSFSPTTTIPRPSRIPLRLSPTSAMRFSLAALAAVALPAAHAAISIIAPSASEYWVQDTTNTITWSYSAGDPSPINIFVNNLQNTTLNGNFSIATYVNVSAESFTVTNVTLVTGGNYEVVFADPANATTIYATSGTFSVDAPGTSPAPSVSPSGTGSASSGSANASGSGASHSASSSGSGASTTTTQNAAAPALSVSTGGIMGVIAACGIASLSALLL
ncbi:hypothetical protein C8Q72DRAFT_857511, partial [Fomitopsis betulina]